ncbi:MAG TPA: hypothetical protein VLK23_09285, partial [Thermodesulfobacteriota bacterium]|nr:hypothetical protein [Thermodesulfobacteriota bacterium]
YVYHGRLLNVNIYLRISSKYVKYFAKNEVEVEANGGELSILRKVDSWLKEEGRRKGRGEDKF